MTAVDLTGMELREIIAYAPPGGVFRPGDYPWLSAIRIVVKPGNGGASADGNPGEQVHAAYAVLARRELGRSHKVTVGRGGKGSGGGRDGEDGSVFIEMYADPAAITGAGAAAGLWSGIRQGLDDVLHPTIRIPNPAYYWRRWRHGRS